MWNNWIYWLKRSSTHFVRWIKEIENELDGKGRIFVRASGTEPLIRILLEGEDKNKLEKISQGLRGVIEKEDI